MMAGGRELLCAENSSQISHQFAQSDAAESERDRLILENIAVVDRVVGRVASRLPSSIDRDDLHSAGVLGLIRAAERFDHSRAVRFKTYAEVRIRGAIIDYLRSMSWAPRSLFRRIRQVDEARRSVENEAFRSATATEVAGQLGLTENAYNCLMRELQRIDVIRVDLVDDQHQCSRPGVRTGPEADPSVHLERKEALEIISQSIEDLPERLKLVLWLYYYEQLTMKEVGSVLNVNEARASQLHSKAIKDLKCVVSRRLQSPTQASRDIELSQARTGGAQ
jgi:RNA polymerase sigma factor for flagellar operon FliA